ncbi:MAG: anhydro-N-acetylmuramic acid kinase [Magnetovibrio sp.]|nr:anhydro-N-acetylmuramic acid kinase [Magnetovibrio sp.]
MNTGKLYTAIGLMSGTSLDGIDISLIKTDGEGFVEFGPSMAVGYDIDFRDRVRELFGAEARNKPNTAALERDLTLKHADLVKAFMENHGLSSKDVDLIGFHGQTVHHDPAEGITIQLGDGQLLAEELGIAVVNDLRTRDVEAGGEGAPLVPVYHRALLKQASQVQLPAVVVNIGGVSNVTWVGEDNILAFDTGPGNAPMNDWVCGRIGQDMDRDGALAAKGVVDEDRIAKALDNPFFDRVPPKSLDRQDFDPKLAEGLSLEDGAATLTAFTARAIAKAADHFPAPASTWVVTGGGRLNPVLMGNLRTVTGAEVLPVEALGWNGDALEAQAFAYLAVRSVLGLPITFPTTTGVTKSLRGGMLYMTEKNVGKSDPKRNTPYFTKSIAAVLLAFAIYLFMSLELFGIEWYNLLIIELFIFLIIFIEEMYFFRKAKTRL